MFAILAAAFPILAGLVAGPWLLIEQARRKVLRDRLVKVMPQRASIHERHRAGKASTEYDEAGIAADAEWNDVLRSHGINPERLRRATYSDIDADAQVGKTMPWSEVVRQSILLAASLLGVLFLVLHVVYEM